MYIERKLQPELQNIDNETLKTLYYVYIHDDHNDGDNTNAKLKMLRKMNEQLYVLFLPFHMYYF